MIHFFLIAILTILLFGAQKLHNTALFAIYLLILRGKNKIHESVRKLFESSFQREVTQLPSILRSGDIFIQTNIVKIVIVENGSHVFQGLPVLNQRS